MRQDADAGRAEAAVLAAVLCFAVLADGAHDLWASTLVYVAALGLAWAVLARRSWAADAPGIDVSLAAPGLAAAAALALSWSRARHPGAAFQGAMDWLAALLLAFSARHALAGARARRLLAGAVSALVCVELAVLLRQHWVLATAPGAPTEAKAVVLYWMSMQLPGTMVNSSAATALMLLWTPFLLAQARAGRGRPGSALRWAGAVAAPLAVVSLSSTWGMLCLAAAAPLLAGPGRLLGLLRRRRREAAVAALLAAAALAAVLAWKFGHRVNLNGDPLPAGENTRRLSWWSSAWRMFLDHPWTGIGPGGFGGAYPAYKAGGVQNTRFAHNWVVGLLAETGLAGVAAAAGLWAALLLRSRGRSPEERERDWPLVLGPAAFGVFGLIGLSVEYLANLASAAVLLGAWAAAPAGRVRRVPRSAVLVLGAAALAAVPALLSPLAAGRRCVDGAALLRAGDPAGAAAAYEAAAGLDPRSDDALRGWADALTLLAVRDADPAALARAADLRRRALALNPLSRALRGELELAEAALAAGPGRLGPSSLSPPGGSPVE